MIRVAVITVSDSSAARAREDLSGPAVASRCEALGWSVRRREVVPDEQTQLTRLLVECCGTGDYDVVLTTGGTGVAIRDVTPEATRIVVERELPGVAELMRAEGLKFTRRAVLSRAVAGTRARTFILNLPGSPKGAVQSLDAVSDLVVHITDLLNGRTSPSPTMDDLPRRSDIEVRVNYVIAPTTVLDKEGHFVNGLNISNFMVYDNDKQQRIVQDVVFQPISLVVAVQANSSMEGLLPKVQKMGSVLDTMVLGDDGEMALLSFNQKVSTLQEFTTDYKKISDGMKSLKLGASSSRLNDGAMAAIRMLRSRPQNRRRIVLLITETRDVGSEARARDVLLEAQFANVLIYTIDISHLLAAATSTPMPPRPDPIPPEAHHLPTGQAMTPTMQSQVSVGNWIPAFVEIFKGVKGIFVDNPAELYTKFTGGREYNFSTQRSLETAISDLGDELHSQYLLSYAPNNLSEAGFHNIRVEVNVPGLKIRTRPGYWIAARPQ